MVAYQIKTPESPKQTTPEPEMEHPHLPRPARIAICGHNRGIAAPLLAAEGIEVVADVPFSGIPSVVAEGNADVVVVALSDEDRPPESMLEDTGRTLPFVFIEPIDGFDVTPLRQAVDPYHPNPIISVQPLDITPAALVDVVSIAAAEYRSLPY